MDALTLILFVIGLGLLIIGANLVRVICSPICLSGRRIASWEGTLFLGYYAAYTAYLVLSATGNAGLPAFSNAMAWFVFPLTALVLAVSLLRDLRARHRVTKPTSI